MPYAQTLLLLLTVTLGACAARAPDAPAPDAETGAPPGFPEARYRSLPPATVYRVTEGRLTVRVYRAGRLKQFGHNHVLTSDQIAGLLHVTPAGAGFGHLYLPVATLVVDDPEARAAAGEDFAGTISEENRQGTRDNLLGPRVLDAATHPFLEVTLTAPEPVARPEAGLDLVIRLKGAEHSLPVTVTWSAGGGALSASSRFTVGHAALGLTPFSVLGGAISVAEEIEVALDVRAVTAGL